MIVALTGATGIVGRFVAERLAREGVALRALVRASSDRRELPADVEWVVGGMTDSSSLANLVENADAVVHCAYEHVSGRYRGGEGDDLPGFWRANLHGGVELMQKAVEAGVTRLVLLSSRAVFGQPSPPGSWVDDDTRPVPDTHYGALKLALEAHASAFAAVDGVCFLQFAAHRRLRGHLSRGANQVAGPRAQTGSQRTLAGSAPGNRGPRRRCGGGGLDPANGTSRSCHGASLQLFGSGGRHARCHGGHRRPAADSKGAAVACDEPVAKPDAFGWSS